VPIVNPATIKQRAAPNRERAALLSRDVPAENERAAKDTTKRDERKKNSPTSETSKNVAHTE